MKYSLVGMGQGFIHLNVLSEVQTLRPTIRYSIDGNIEPQWK